MVEKDAVRRGYDEVAEEFAARRSFDDEEREIFEEFLDSLPPGSSVLDAGCGQGTPILRALAERTSESPPIGLDVSAVQLDLASERVPEATLIRGDFTHLPLVESSVDGVVAFHSLIHVPADEHRQAIEEFARVVRPGGRVLLSEGTEPWRGSNPDWLETGAEMQWHIAGAETTREQIRDAGLAIENEWTTGDVLVEGESWTFFEAVLTE